MPKARARGERVTISAPLVPIIQTIQTEEHCADLSETVNWIIRDWLKQCRGSGIAITSLEKPGRPVVSSPSEDLNSILRDMS